MPYPGFKNKRDGHLSDADRAYRPGSDEQRTDKPGRAAKVDTAGKTETFFTANVRLITALVTIAVLLALIGPWSIFQLKRWYDARQEDKSDGILISQTQLDALIARGPELTWKDFDGYTYDVISDGIVYMCQYDVEGGRYYLWVTSSAKGKSVESVLLIDMQNDYQETELKAVD